MIETPVEIICSIHENEFLDDKVAGLWEIARSSGTNFPVPVEPRIIVTGEVLLTK